MKEKVLYVSLPEGAEYQRVEVAEDGKIGIVYTEQCESKDEITEVAQAVSEARPTPSRSEGSEDLSETTLLGDSFFPRRVYIL